MNIITTPRPTSSLLEIAGLALIMAAVLGLYVPVLNNAIIVPPAHGPVPRWAELGLGVLLVLIGMALQEERASNPLALLTSRIFFALLMLGALNAFAWLSQYGPATPARQVPSSRMAGDWKGPWTSPVYGTSQARLLLRNPAGTNRLIGTLSVGYRNGWCVFDLASVTVALDRATMVIKATRSGSDRCQSGLGDHLVLEGPDPRGELLSVVEVSGADSMTTLFQGHLSRDCAAPGAALCPG